MYVLYANVFFTILLYTIKIYYLRFTNLFMRKKLLLEVWGIFLNILQMLYFSSYEFLWDKTVFLPTKELDFNHIYKQ